MGQLVGYVLRSDETEAERVLEAGDRLGRATTFGAGSHVRGRGGGEAQPAAWAAEAGHGDHSRFFPGRPYPHAGQTRFITGWSESSSSSSNRPGGLEAGHAQDMSALVQLYFGLGSGLRECARRSGSAISVAPAIRPPPHC